MTISIRKLTIVDLDAVDKLMKYNSKTLGFLPKEALRDYLEKGYTLGAKNDDGKLIGYLLHAANPKYFRIAHLCVAEGFTEQGIARRLIDELKKLATSQKFISFVRFCLSRSLTRTEVLSEIDELFPGIATEYKPLQELDLQKYCSPLDLKETEQNHFLIPIRSGYATSLFDRQKAASDMFVQKPNVLLRWDNVYYRAKTHHHTIKATARLLWYESGSEAGQIIAISCLEAVKTGTAKTLFKQFKKFGVLEWKDIFDMCNGDPGKEIMALKFSHTFLFRKPVSLDAMRSVFSRHETSLVLQSPSKIPTEIFYELFQMGYPAQP